MNRFQEFSKTADRGGGWSTEAGAGRVHATGVEAPRGPLEQAYSIIHKIVQKERALGTVASTVPTHPPWYYSHSTQILI